MRFLVYMIIGALLALSVSCHGKDNTDPAPQQATGTAIVSWNAATTYTDGSPLSPAGYKIYRGTAHNTYTDVLTIPAPDVRLVDSKPTYTYTMLPAGKAHHFAVTVYDVDGNESAISAEVSKTI